MSTDRRKIPLRKIGRSNHSDRRRLELWHFAEDLDTALERIARIERTQNIVTSDFGDMVAYWQTAVVKIARWFDYSQEGIQFNPWEYVEEGEEGTLKLALRLRSQWMTRKSYREPVLELLAVDDETMQIIPSEMSIVEAAAVTEDAMRVQIVGPGTHDTSKIPETSFGILFLPQEVGPIEEITDLFEKIRDSVRRELYGG